MADTKEVIQERMLNNISSEYDRSEGSFFYDITKANAIEYEKLDVKSDNILDKRFADTATGKDLDRVVKEEGLKRKLTTKSEGIVTITGLNGAKIQKGEKVASGEVNFVFLEDSTIPMNKIIDVKIQCESYGSKGNVPAGAIKYFPKTLAGLQTVTNAKAISNGYDEESDESLRERYYTKIRTPETSGNKYHYLNWATSITGVGAAKVTSLWRGNGTVKLTIMNSNGRSADNALLQEIKNYIDPYPEGHGEGQAPIGATLTVTAAIEKSINIMATLKYETNYTENMVSGMIKESITKYLKELAFKKDYVSYAKIGDAILAVEGIEDYSNLKINDGTENISLANEEVPVLGGVVFG